MSDRNDLISLILGGLIVYIFLYFTGKIIGTVPANLKEESALTPCGGCGKYSQTPIPSNENLDVTGRYIYSAAVLPVTTMS